MNAVLRESNQAERADMPTSERDDLMIQVAELRSDVHHVQADTTQIKADLRLTNQRIDALDDKMDQRIAALDDKMDQRIAALDVRMEKRLDNLADALTSAKHWAIGMYITLAGGLFYMVAHGLKWL
ncbi:MAG TPA: hypothetical protein VHB68_19655 [Steroidobacteraceae bacterium]|nr:hypothetical protein [Steroidobacteraceae bacterium]